MTPATSNLRARLIRLNLAAISVTLLLISAFAAAYELTTFRPRAIAQARAQTEILTDIVIPSLEFDDPGTAGKLLEVIRHDPAMESAAVYDGAGRLFAQFRRTPEAPAPPAADPTHSDQIVGSRIIISSRIQSGGYELGRVWLSARLPGWPERIRQYGPLLLLAALSAVGLSIGIALATRRQITDPVQSLAEAARGIARNPGALTRVPEQEGGEVGELARAFNGMLDAISDRDRRLHEREARLVRHNAGLARLTRAELEDEAGFTRALQDITELAADIQAVERVSVWFLDEARAAITCADLFMRGANRHESGGRLAREDFSAYFRLLDEGIVLEIHDARADPRAREFVAGYLDLHGVGAMLDVPIRWRGRVVGVVCHEHVGPARGWHADETALAAAFAERIAHLLESRETMRADAARRESDARFRDFISQAQDAIFTLSLDGRIQSVNDAARRITGWELNTWIGHRFQRVLLPEDVTLAEQRFAEVVQGQVPPSFELRIRTRQGGLVTLEFVVSPQHEGGRVVGLLGIGRDVTERKQATDARARLEEQLRQSQKMEAIGTMAGGIAHDFNNILTAIIGNAQLAELDTERSHPAHAYLEQTLIASHRAKELVQQILAFSRRSEQKLVAVPLARVVKESLKLLRPVLAPNIRIDSHLPEDLPPVLADSTQLQQVVVNLATNAAHAMEEHGGLLELGLEAVEVDLEMVSLDPKLKPGRFVKLAVTDSGTGMSPATLEKIFDPFFTTKPKEKGTGLGLAVVHGIVQQHGGVISVYSAQGEGTTFLVYLPVAETAPAPVRVAESVDGRRGRGQAVLLVDDETQVLGVASNVLLRHGYRPVTYQDPRLALAAVREHPAHWRLIITDQLMPEMKGTMLAAEIWKIRPDIPIILATGFAGNLDEAAVHRSGFAGLLQKPFTRDSLLNLVAQVMTPKT